MDFRTIKQQQEEIKCDNCGYICRLRNKSSLKHIKKLIGKKCPKCNTLMIEEIDYKIYRDIRITIAVFNVIFFPLKLVSMFWCLIKGKKEPIKKMKFNTHTGVENV